MGHIPSNMISSDPRSHTSNEGACIGIRNEVVGVSKSHTDVQAKLREQEERHKTTSHDESLSDDEEHIRLLSKDGTLAGAERLRNRWTVLRL